MKNKIIPFYALLFSVVASVFMACQPAPTNDNSANVEAAEKIIAASLDLWNNKNVNALDSCTHADFKRITPFGTVEGLEAYKASFEQTFQTWSDAKLEISEHWVNGDVITMMWNWTGTNTGPLGEGIPATGKTISVPGMSKITMVDGKVMEDRLFWDRLASNETMGFTLVPPQLAEADTEGGEANE